MNRDYQSRRNQSTYISGNTVRQMEETPELRRERIRRELEEQRREEERKERIRRVTRRNQERALGFGKGYVTFLAVAVMIVAVMSLGYVKLQSDITSRMKAISKMESQLEDITAENAATQKRINVASDINTIKDAAINRLGMVYASENQIVNYSVEDGDYMTQYEDIPKN